MKWEENRQLDTNSLGLRKPCNESLKEDRYGKNLWITYILGWTCSGGIT